jgi:tetratricopeptide (TPR) repeat protein/predicted aspartyl protease
VALLSLALFLLAPVLTIAGQCHIKALEVPVTMNGLRPTLTAQINGVNAVFTLDSGAWWSHISPAAAEQYKLRPDSTRFPGMYEVGANGRADVKVATVATFTIFNVPIHKIDFLVGGSDPGAGTVGLLGQNILRFADIEYDLAQGSIHFLMAKDCKNNNLAYWVKPGEAFSRIDIQTATALEPHTVGTAYLNGAKIRVLFDTGATGSIVGLRAAEKAGIKPDSPGVEEAQDTTGIGRKWVKTWKATFPNLKIGDEEIHNARLRFADIGDFDLLLGADFFLSHHVYVASSQSKLYFTYNGGPVFNYAAAAARARAAATASAGSATSAAPIETPTSDATPTSGPAPTSGSRPTLASSESSAGAAASANTAASGTAARSAGASERSEPADAPALARRAAASAARHDFENALQDYNRAIELAPKEPPYFYQRALTQLSLGRTEAGAADIQTAIGLDPGYIDALFVRAEINQRKHAFAEVIEDLDAVDRLAPKEAAIRFQLAALYAGAKRSQASIDQLNLWIAHHPDDVELPKALNQRCWDRAVLDQGLDQALDDCNRAVRSQPKSAMLLDTRGFVHLRRKEFGAAIADYDTALKINPKLTWALYCRGVAKSRLGKERDGATDISAAVAQDAHIVERAKHFGFE